jgi:hypothetical protein
MWRRCTAADPLWRAVGRVIDLAMILEGTPPRPVAAPEGCAIVPATRGYYAVSVGTQDGHVTSLARITPTDHMLAPGGALAAMLSRLPPDRAMLLPVLMTLVDPCRPLNVEAARNA